MSWPVVRRRSRKVFPREMQVIQPRRPEPFACHASADPVPPGPQHLTNLARLLLRRAGPEHEQALRRWIHRQPVWPVASVCSGSESPMLAWQGFAEAVAIDIGAAFPLTHAFACERDPMKRSWIKAVFPQTLLFCDVLDLAHGRAPDHAGVEQEVPSNWANLMGGFPCTTASRLNSRSSTHSNRTCIQHGTDMRLASPHLIRRKDVYTTPVFGWFLGLQQLLGCPDQECETPHFEVAPVMPNCTHVMCCLPH